MKPINRAFTPIVGMALATKDGQRCGNGHVINEEYKCYGTNTFHLFHVMTDFGHVMKLTKNEVNELFDVANWWVEQEDNQVEGLFYQTDFMCPVAKVKRQLELLTGVLKERE
jgi:hypothetical protein